MTGETRGMETFGQALEVLLPAGDPQLLLELRDTRQAKHRRTFLNVSVDIRRLKRLMGQQKGGEHHQAEVILNRPVP